MPTRVLEWYINYKLTIFEFTAILLIRTFLVGALFGLKKKCVLNTDLTDLMSEKLNYFLYFYSL